MPVQVRGAHDGAAVPCHETRHGDREPGRPQSLGLRFRDDPPHQTGELLEHRLRRTAPVAPVPYGTRAYPPAQVDRADREMVDADLRPDAGRALCTDGERGPGPAHAAGALGAQLLQQARADEFVHEGRHRRTRQPDP